MAKNPKSKPTPIIAAHSPIIGVEPSENNTYRGAVYEPLGFGLRKLARISNKRLPYSAAMADAASMANFGFTREIA